MSSRTKDATRTQVLGITHIYINRAQVFHFLFKLINAALQYQTLSLSQPLPYIKMASPATVDPEEVYTIHAYKAASIIMTHDAKKMEINSLVKASSGRPTLRSILTNFPGHDPADEQYDLFYFNMETSLYLCGLWNLNECKDLIIKNLQFLECPGCQRAPGGTDREHRDDTKVELPLAPAVPVRCLRHLGLVSLKDVLTFQGLKPWDIPIRMHEICRTSVTFTVLMPGETRVQPFIDILTAIELMPEEGGETFDLRERLVHYKNEMLNHLGLQHLGIRQIMHQNGMIIVMFDSRYLLMRRSDLKLYGPAIRPFVRNNRARMDDMAPSDTVESWIAIADVGHFGQHHDRIFPRLQEAATAIRLLPLANT